MYRYEATSILCTLKSFLNVLFWQMKQKSHLMGSYWERVTTLVCDIVETCSVLVKFYLICFENTADLFTCIFSIAITVVNNFNFTWYKIVYCGYFLQNKRIHLISFNFNRSYKTIFAYISHTNHRFCIGTLTYNALLPVQRFFSPFWTRRRKFQRTTERCHHTEYERVCLVKFWYYNSLITNQQNTLIIDKQTTKTTPNEIWKPQ